MQLVTNIAQIVLGCTLLFTGLAAAFRSRLPVPMVSLAAMHPMSSLSRLMVAALFCVAGIATFAGCFVPFLVFFASCLAFAVSILLIVLGARPKSARAWFVPISTALLSVAVAIAQPLGLKVLALPKADDVSFQPSAARVIKTYDEGLWFEGIAAGSDGTLYLAGNRGLDFSRSDYYHAAQGELIERKSDGAERVLFRTPRGATAGVVALAADGAIYLTSHGDEPGIWRIAPDGTNQRLAQLPPGAWPNGLDVGPDGMLYSPDSALGLIWRVDPRSGKAEVALRDSALQARAFISLAPGANGLHFSGRDMLVTVSDRTTVLKYAMDAQGIFGPAAIVATGIPGDDFAIGRDGSLFITTHPYNTVVRLTASGQRTIIAKAYQHVVGATDAVFGRGLQDLDTLYVVTDGGAFTGGSKTRGELIAIQPYARK